MAPTQRKSGFASLIRPAIGPNSRLPNSHSSHRTSVSPRVFATSRAPTDMNCTDGNLLVTMAIVFGGLGDAASAFKTVLGNVVAGSGPSDHVGNCMSYLARLGMPKVWWMSILL